MVGPLFTISAINVARAAIHKADRALGLSTPVQLSIDSHDPSQVLGLFIRISGPDQQTREVAVDDAAVEACVSGVAYVDVLVNELAAQVSEAAREVLA
jgi:hypothetical protein